MSSRARFWLTGLAGCVVTALAYSNSFGTGFPFDNPLLILSDARVHAATAENVGLIFHHTYGWPNVEAGLYRPLTTLTYLLNYAVLGNADQPAGYHAVNLGLHLINVLLVFALARRLVQGEWQPALAAALWAVHPVLTESVTNIVGRADLLAGMSVVGGLLLYIRSAEATGWRRFVWLGGLAVSSAAGVFSKESAVVILPVIVLYEVTWPERRRIGTLASGVGALVPGFVWWWLARGSVLAASGPALLPFLDNPISGASFWTGRVTAVEVLLRYVGLLLWPARLSGDYSYPQIPLATGGLNDWLSCVVAAVFVITGVWMYRRCKAAFFATGFAFIVILPTSNLLIPVGTIMAERFLYLPAVGFAICVTLGLGYVSVRLRLPAAVPVTAGILLVAALGGRTWMRNPDWQDEFTFWSANAQTSPLSSKVHIALGQQYLTPEHLDPDRAFQEDERALALLNDLPDELNNPAAYIRVAGQYVWYGDQIYRSNAQASRADWQRAREILLRARPMIDAHHRADRSRRPGLLSGIMKSVSVDTNAETALNLGLADADARLGRIDDAIDATRRAQIAGPGSAGVYRHLYELLRAAGRGEEASKALLTGVLVTHDAGLRSTLTADWTAKPESLACGADASCGAFRALACSVRDEVVRWSLAAKGPDAAALANEELAVKYGCAAGR